MEVVPPSSRRTLNEAAHKSDPPTRRREREPRAGERRTLNEAAHKLRHWPAPRASPRAGGGAPRPPAPRPSER